MDGYNRTHIRNLRENESGEMEGEVYFSAIKQNIMVIFDKKVPMDYVKWQIEYLWSLDDKIIQKMCYYANLYRKDIMEDCPNQDYPEGLDGIKDPLELLEYMGITCLKVDLYKNESVKEVRVLNLMGWCDWDEENGIEWLIKEDKVVYTGANDWVNIWHSPYENNLFNYALKD